MERGKNVVQEDNYYKGKGWEEENKDVEQR